MAQVMLITGGSRGIGAATARLAAARGYQVAINYRARSQTPPRRWRARPAALPSPRDVAAEADVLRMFDEVDRKLGRLNVLVNNAGIVDRARARRRNDAARMQRMFAINVTGSFLCAREAVKRMSTRHGGTGGSIVNLSSVAARIGAPGRCTSTTPRQRRRSIR